MTGGNKMPMHDWTRVDAGIFHAFHHDWITEIGRALNRGVLPSDYYALPEQVAGGLGPDVLTLQRPVSGLPSGRSDSDTGLCLATAPPKVKVRLRSDADWYAAKTKAVIIRHSSDHKVIAIVEIVSPGNKNNKHGLRAFVKKAVEMLQAGVHLLIVDPFPPGRRDPNGIQKAIWDEVMENGFSLTPDKPLTLASYLAGPAPEAFIEPLAVGTALTDMPLFVTAEDYFPTPLEPAYQAAFDGFAKIWREVVEAG
jgi:hypothetical protein